MTLSHLKVATLFSTFFAFLTMTAGSAKADHFDIMHSYAKTLESQAERIERDVNSLCSHLPFYRDLKADVREMERLADHIHDITHDKASLRHIESDLRDLDARFHEVEAVAEQLRRMTRSSADCRHNRIDEYQVRRLNDRINEMGGTLHAMQDTLRAMQRACDRPAPIEYIPARPAYRPRTSVGVHYDGRNVTVPVHHERNRFSFSIQVR